MGLIEEQSVSGYFVTFLRNILSYGSQPLPLKREASMITVALQLYASSSFSLPGCFCPRMAAKVEKCTDQTKRSFWLCDSSLVRTDLDEHDIVLFGDSEERLVNSTLSGSSLVMLIYCQHWIFCTNLAEIRGNPGQGRTFGTSPFHWQMLHPRGLCCCPIPREQLPSWQLPTETRWHVRLVNQVTSIPRRMAYPPEGIYMLLRG